MFNLIYRYIYCPHPAEAYAEADDWDTCLICYDQRFWSKFIGWFKLQQFKFDLRFKRFEEEDLPF